MSVIHLDLLNPENIKIAISFSVGAISGGLAIHLFHIKIVNQHSKGDKSPNTSGKGNKINIK